MLHTGEKTNAQALMAAVRGFDAMQHLVQRLVKKCIAVYDRPVLWVPERRTLCYGGEELKKDVRLFVRTNMAAASELASKVPLSGTGIHRPVSALYLPSLSRPSDPPP